MPNDSPSGCLDNPSAGSGGVRPAPEPFALVIFGASGDLMQRKLLPGDWVCPVCGVARLSTEKTEKTEKTCCALRSRLA